MTNDPWAKPVVAIEPNTGQAITANDPWGKPAADPWGKPTVMPDRVDTWAKPVDTQAAPPPNTNAGWGPVVPPTPTPVVNDDWVKTSFVGAPLEWGAPIDPEHGDPILAAIDEAGLTVAFDIPAREVSANHDKLFAPYGADGSWDTQNPATAWPDAPRVHPDQTSPMTVGREEFEASGWGVAAGFQDPDEKQRQADEAYAQREAQWRDERIMGAEERTRALNAINQQRGQEWAVNQDGELDRLEQPERGKPTGVFIAYKKPNSLLHAILSGPYPDQRAASLWADTAYELMTNDASFKIAFENTFFPEGIYYVELERHRKGAYGVLA